MLWIRTPTTCFWVSLWEDHFCDSNFSYVCNSIHYIKLWILWKGSQNTLTQEMNINVGTFTSIWKDHFSRRQTIYCNITALKKINGSFPSQPTWNKVSCVKESAKTSKEILSPTFETSYFIISKSIMYSYLQPLYWLH